MGLVGGFSIILDGYMATATARTCHWVNSNVISCRSYDMIGEIFNYDSKRARQARLHVFLSGWVRYVILILAIPVTTLSLWLVLTQHPVGWLMAGLAIGLMVPLLWDQRHLSELPPVPGNRIDDRLEPDLLARLPYRLDRDSLIGAMPAVRSVQFVMTRAGISPGLVSDQITDQQIVASWQHALSRKSEGIIWGSDLLAGLVRNDSRLTGVLPHLQLDQQDVELIADWYDHLHELIISHKKPKSTGGIARDWSFGYSHLLERFGVNISEQVASGMLHVDVESHEQAISYLTEVLGSSSKANVALVGAVGSGKTTVIEAFAERLILADKNVPGSLRYRQVIQLDSAALISAASGRGQLEDLMNRLLIEAYKAKNIIVCFDDAELFFEDGVGSVDLTNLLKPILDGGVLKMILSMDEQRFLKISQKNPALAQSLNRFMITPATYEETMRIMQDQIIPNEFRHRVTYMYQALRETYRLSERYMYDVAQPGKSLQLLFSAAQHAQDGLVTAASVQTAIEQTSGVKVGANVQADEKDMLLNLESLIHERMINQTRAVGVVSDAIRRARAGVRNESRPIGTFLFLGPTGVGKTELAKALAEVYFNGEDRLIRLDMNEFVSPDDVRRLIADGADDPNSLSAQVMKQPFSVVLLDEIEKAHDAVLATLLQVLDEGILRDIKGREVSFRDAIIITTSNAGADKIRHHIEAGEQLEQFEQALQDELIASQEFRPEFLNRFDEIVLFRPLTQVELAQVIDLIIMGVNKTLEPQKISVSINTELKAWLVVKGNDPRLGARPMRRMVQRVVENVVAKRMLSGEVQPGQTMELTLADVPEEMR